MDKIKKLKIRIGCGFCLFLSIPFFAGTYILVMFRSLKRHGKASFENMGSVFKQVELGVVVIGVAALLLLTIGMYQLRSEKRRETESRHS